MSLNFPTSPSLFQTYAFGTMQWTYDGVGWRQSVSGAAGSATYPVSFVFNPLLMYPVVGPAAAFYTQTPWSNTSLTSIVNTSVFVHDRPGSPFQVMNIVFPGSLPTPTPSVVNQSYLSQQSLLHFDGTNGATTTTDFYAGTGPIFTNATISTTQAKFGASSASFNGTSAYARINLVPGNFHGDFTVEMFIYATSFTTSATLADNGGSALQGLHLYSVGTNGAIGATLSVSGTATDLTLTSVTTMTTGAWHHVALIRSGTTVTLYQDGNSVASGTLSGVLSTNTLTESLYIGGSPNFNTYFNGFIDEFRLHSSAAYTTNFTPPVSAYTS